MKADYRIVASWAFAAVCLTLIATTPIARAEMNANGAEVITNGPQVSPGDRPAAAQSGSQNVRDSDHYESVLHTNPGYRSAREQKECGSITEPRMHEQCIASFGK